MNPGKLYKIRIKDPNIPAEYHRYDVAFCTGSDTLVLTDGNGSTWYIGSTQVEVLEELLSYSLNGSHIKVLPAAEPSAGLKAVFGQEVKSLTVEFK